MKELECLASLQENERLWIKGESWKKNKAPNRFLKNSKNCFVQTLHTIITAIVQAVQALGRKWSRQCEDANIEKIQALFHSLVNTIDKKVNKTHFYERLQELGKIKQLLEKPVIEGLENYQKTWKTKKKNRANRVATLIQMVKDQVLPKVEQKIAAMHEGRTENDTVKVKKFLEKLKCIGPEAAKAYNFKATKPAVYQVLSDYDGKKAIDRALSFYGLEKMEVLTGDDINALLIGIKANLTLDDVEGLSTDKVLRDYLVEMRSFSAHKPTIAKSCPYGNQLRKDVHFLERCMRIHHYTEQTGELSKFGYAEHLSRDLIYGLFYGKSDAKFAEGVLLPLVDRKGKLTCVKAKTLISQDGIHAIFVEPVFLDEKVRLQVVFRGTNCSDSAWRCLNLAEWKGSTIKGGPGGRSFGSVQEKIYDKLLEYLKPYSEREVKLEIMGHSLGGTDSQRLYEYFAFRNDCKVKALNLFTFNSPNIDSDITERFMKSVKKMPNTVFKVRHFHSYGDPFQEGGDGKIGFDAKGEEPPENLLISLFTFNQEPIVEQERWIPFSAKRLFEAHFRHLLTDVDDGNHPMHIEEAASSYPKDQKVFLKTKTQTNEINKRLRTYMAHWKFST